ncbi:MAG: 4Fe-4S binding protein, partial [Bacilli bacterium]
ENPSLDKIYPGDSRYILEVFKFVKGTVETFSVAQEPIERFIGTFGKEKLVLKGFFIHDNCIECGLCKRNCPQDCIVKGTPYRIKQENCLHCGLCEENCPVKAIERY